MERTPRFSRRDIVKAGATAALSVVAPVILFRDDAIAAPGELTMVPGRVNPNGAFEKVYLLKGDPLAGPIRAIVVETGSPVPAPTLAAGERRVLRLFHFNDMHNHVTDPHPARGDTHRFSQMVKRVRDARAAAKSDEIVLFVSGGDDHTGSIFDELLGWDESSFVADASYRVYSAGGVDIAVLGNHEFDRGGALLGLGIRRDARFPVLSANVHGSSGVKMNEDYVAAAIAEAKGLRIGFVGLTTAVDTRVGQPGDPTLAVASPVEALRNVMPALAHVCDLVVVLSHCGFGSGMHRSGKAGSARMIGEGDLDIAAVAGALTEKPVVLVGGHSHTRLNALGLDPANVVDGVLITQAEANGLFLGEIAMSIAAENGRKAWFSSVSLQPIKPRDNRVKADDPRFERLEQDADFDGAFEREHVKPLLDALDEKLKQEIARVEDAAPFSAERTVADRYVRETAIANFMNDALVERSKSFANGRIDLALFNATGLSTGLVDGPLTFKAWFDIMPYADNVHVATMTGAQIRDLLDNNAKRVVRPEELAKETVKLDGFVSRGFLHFSKGLRYRIALGSSAGEARAVDITILGKPVETVLDRLFTLGVNSYVALGGFGEAWNGSPIAGGVPTGIASMDLRKLDYLHTGLVYRNEVIAQIREFGVISPRTGAVLDGRLAIN